jgi:hypothetical protein
MKLTELAELILAVLYDLANSKGHGNYFPVDEAASQFGERDRGKVMEVGRWLRGQGLADVAITTGGTAARITGAGSILVEEGGRTGIIQAYREGGLRTAQLPSYPGPSLKRAEVVNHLLHCKANGWCQEVYEGPGPTEFVIVGEDNRKIVIRGEPQGYVVVGEHLGSQTRVGRAESFGDLVHLIADAGKLHGGQWPARMTSGRLSASTPATNLATISSLVGSSEIQAAFDPYLENRSLTTLLDILSFGGSISNSVRLLSSIKMTQGAIPRLTKTVVDAWFVQRGITAGEVRLMSPSEHRRFMLLSGGQSLILGPSLNSIAKNEATHLEPDTADRAFFDGVWATATPLT